MTQKELEKFIIKHQELYYDGNPEISDDEFDKYFNQLKKEYPKSKILKNIGTTTTKGFQKAEHFHIMGSQNKCADMKEFETWYNRKKRADLIVSLKLDGASIALYYLNGKFDKAITRGNGKIGDLCKDNVLKMNGFPLEVSDNFSGQIRGEVLLLKENLKYFPDAKNCRNMAVGAMKRKDGEGCDKLNIICYDIYSACDLQFEREIKKLEWLLKNKFEVVPYEILFSPEDVEKFRKKIQDSRNKIRYDLDGLVIKDDIIDEEDCLRERPLNSQIALKFDLEQAETILREVEWSENFGQFTPVAIFDPVQLDGTTVSRASLANTNIMGELNLCIGDTVEVTKRGEIIPKIISVIKHIENGEKIKIIDKCPCCNTPLIDTKQTIYCPNINCDLTKLHNLKKWIDEMEIQFIGPEILEKLYYQCNCKEIHNLFELEVEDISKIDGMGEKIAKKIIKEIRNDKNFKLDKIIAGVFDNRLIGSKRIRNLINAGYNTFEKLKNLKIDEIKEVDGWSDVLANEWVDMINLKSKELDLLLI
ncbi:MAG: DNA ligase (NAD(+)) LigA [Elusimicrobiota bacterium]|jgi:DNA ligase (NAD+)|nr:DNA ligase (NAD(+)) LigA [Elusimicrobiota bacterium]